MFLCGLALLLYKIVAKLLYMKIQHLFYGLIFVLSSCSTTKTATTPVDVNKPVAEHSFFEAIATPSNFQQVKINSRINIDTGAFIPTLDATIYIENGKKVWMNIMAVIFNAGRGIATPEGIKGYEKWNKTYIDSDFAYLNNLLNVNFIDYQALQNLLVGKTFIPVSENDFVLTENAQGYALQSKKNQIINKNGFFSEYKIQLQYALDGTLNQVFLNEIRKNETLEINYSDWVSVENSKFPKNVKIIIKNDKTSQIQIENTNFAFVPMETPYSVPANYKKTEIK